MSTSRDFIKNLLKAWRDEMLSAGNYRALAARERNPERRTILLRMAEAEDRHAERWATRLRELGTDPGKFRESLADRFRKRILLKSTTEGAVQLLEAGEASADHLYKKMITQAVSEEDRKALLETKREENAHTKMLEEMVQSSEGLQPARRLEKILRVEKWHVTAGGWIGQAIYGVNDGLGAAFGVVSGVAGATNANGKFVLLSGLATAIASALSMGSGAYLATKSEREIYQAELERERGEIEANPEEEREEMELFYQLKGFSPEESHMMAERLAAQPEQLLKALAHEELGLSEQTFPNPVKAALSATISTAMGAIVPVIPFFFTSGLTALWISFLVSTMAHFAVGASKVFVTGRSWLRGGAEMTVVGVGEALITYTIGILIAPALR